jgi:hypothetical protein
MKARKRTKLTETVAFRLTPEERAFHDAAAEKLNMRKSDYYRAVVNANRGVRRAK